MAVEEIVPGVWAVDQSVADGKNGVVIGERAALAIDTGNSLQDGQAVVDVIRGQGWEPSRLALTHGHGDHILGGGAFRGAEVYAHRLTPDTMRRHLPPLAKRYGMPLDDLAASLAWPTVTYTHELWLDLGSKTVRLFPAPGHSPDGTCAFVVEDRVLFGADAAVTGIVPAIHDGDSRVLEQSLRRLIELDADVLVPGHGAVVRGAEAVRASLRWVADYLAAVRQCVRDALAAGASAEAAVEAATYDRLVGDWLARDRHNMPQRHRDTVGFVVREEIKAIEVKH
jgi:cyclase